MDLIRRSRQAFPRSKVAIGTAAQPITIELEKVWALEELQIRVSVAQSFTGVPASADVRRFFQKIELKTDKGDGVKLNFHAAYDFGRITENTPAPFITLAANSTADFVFDIHFANDGAVGELATALLSGKYSMLTLELTPSADATNGFIGGTVPLAAAYTVEVMPKEMRDQTPADRGDESQGWGKAEHWFQQMASLLSAAGGGTNGISVDLPVKSGNKTRFVLMHFFDAAVLGNLTDAPIVNGGRITLEVDGFKYFDNTLLSAIRQQNVTVRNNLGVGTLLLDFGDDPRQWCDTRNVKDPKGRLEIPPSANLPANFRVEYALDYTKGLEKLPGQLAA